MKLLFAWTLLTVSLSLHGHTNNANAEDIFEGDCVNEPSPLPAVDLCQTTDDCRAAGYITCRQLDNYKVCSDGVNYLGFPRVCMLDEIPGPTGNYLFPPTLSPVAADDDEDRAETGPPVDVAVPTPAPVLPPTLAPAPGVKCVPAGPSFVPSKDVCVSNVVGPCPGFCKRYNWNVCDEDGNYGFSVLPLCTPAPATNAPATNAPATNAPANTPSPDGDRTDSAGSNAVDITPSPTKSPSPPTGDDNGCILGGNCVLGVNCCCAPAGPSPFPAQDQCITNLGGPCDGHCKAYAYNVCDPDNAYANAPAVLPLCLP